MTTQINGHVVEATVEATKVYYGVVREEDNEVVDFGVVEGSTAMEVVSALVAHLSNSE